MRKGGLGESLSLSTRKEGVVRSVSSPTLIGIEQGETNCARGGLYWI